MQVCTPDSEGTPQQTDNCAPGLVCLERAVVFRPLLPVLQERRRLHEFDLHARGRPGQAVGRRSAMFRSSTAAFRCWAGKTRAAGPATTMACWLSSTSPTRTFCDCPFGATGSNGPCTRTRDCVRGLTCVDRGDGRASDLFAGLPAREQWSVPAAIPRAAARTLATRRGTAAHPTFGYCYLGGWRPGDIGRWRRGPSWWRSCRPARAASSPRSRTAAFCARAARTAAFARRGSTAPPTAPAAKGTKMACLPTSPRPEPICAPDPGHATAIRSARAAVIAGAARTTEQAWSVCRRGEPPSVARLCTPGADDCAPGNFCRRDCKDTIGRCYRFCGNGGNTRDVCGGQICQTVLQRCDRQCRPSWPCATRRSRRATPSATATLAAAPSSAATSRTPPAAPSATARAPLWPARDLRSVQFLHSRFSLPRGWARAPPHLREDLPAGRNGLRARRLRVHRRAAATFGYCPP